MADRLALRLLHNLGAERAHNLSVRLSQAAGAVPPLGWMVERRWGVPEHPVTVFGVTFRNRIGIAAGFDKDAIALRGLGRLGIGHVEVGTVTPEPQQGNARPRVFRLSPDHSVINRMGFPSRGAEFVAQRLRRGAADTVVGINLGKARSTDLEDAAADYLKLVDRMAPLADYLTINVSSPNTPGLRELQRGTRLEELLSAIAARRGTVPVLAKLSPDLDDDELDDALEAVANSGIDGVVATNTTLRRDGLSSPLAAEDGGLSGAALTKMSTRMVSEISRRTGGSLPIIAAGGVASGTDAASKLDAGADLVQVYTGLVFRGPALLRELVAATK
ncbi:MAG: quinone-dependent dihydroorotate dehydrogenase [Acidimicrobiia bacterium]|nr:quinone-dependent dihydroorotate dehydrogenase [Acidimicrobiia bacterium]